MQSTKAPQQIRAEAVPKENEMSLIGLDFSKKQKTRPKTERISSTNIHSTMNSPSLNQKFSVIKNQQTETTISLLQKKKQYSMAIREKNLTLNQTSQNVNSSQNHPQDHENQNINPIKQSAPGDSRKSKQSNAPQQRNKNPQSRNKSSGDILCVSNLSNLNISHLQQTQDLKTGSHQKHLGSSSKIEWQSGKKKLNSPTPACISSSHKLSKAQKEISGQKGTSGAKQFSGLKEVARPKPREKREQARQKVQAEGQLTECQFEDNSISFVSVGHYFSNGGDRMSQEIGNFSKIDKINEFSRIECAQDDSQQLIPFQEPKAPSPNQEQKNFENFKTTYLSSKIAKNIVTPQVFCLSVGPFPTEEKQLDQLRKHNATYKKELSNFRRENSSLKREIDELKKQLDLVKERNEFLQEREREQLEIMESMRNKMNQSIDLASSISRGEADSSFVFLEKEVQRPDRSPIEAPGAIQGEVSPDDKLKQILCTYQNDLFEAVNLNKKLEFRNYMLQKKLMDTTEIHRKQMAKQIAIWKERYIKARNENLRMKDHRGMMLLEMSISQDME